jgi:adenosine deaminase
MKITDKLLEDIHRHQSRHFALRTGSFQGGERQLVIDNMQHSIGEGHRYLARTPATTSPLLMLMLNTTSDVMSIG